MKKLEEEAKAKLNLILSWAVKEGMYDYDSEEGDYSGDNKKGVILMVTSVVMIVMPKWTDLGEYTVGDISVTDRSSLCGFDYKICTVVDVLLSVVVCVYTYGSISWIRYLYCPVVL